MAASLGSRSLPTIGIQSRVCTMPLIPVFGYRWWWGVGYVVPWSGIHRATTNCNESCFFLTEKLEKFMPWIVIFLSWIATKRSRIVICSSLGIALTTKNGYTLEPSQRHTPRAIQLAKNKSCPFLKYNDPATPGIAYVLWWPSTVFVFYFQPSTYSVRILFHCCFGLLLFWFISDLSIVLII